jgi:hypothetical protein
VGPVLTGPPGLLLVLERGHADGHGLTLDVGEPLLLTSFPHTFFLLPFSLLARTSEKHQNNKTIQHLKRSSSILPPSATSPAKTQDHLSFAETELTTTPVNISNPHHCHKAKNGTRSNKSMIYIIQQDYTINEARGTRKKKKKETS